jgi:hypothetical protein
VDDDALVGADSLWPTEITKSIGKAAELLSNKAKANRRLQKQNKKTTRSAATFVARQKQTLSLCTCKQVGQSGPVRSGPAAKACSQQAPVVTDVEYRSTTMVEVDAQGCPCCSLRALAFSCTAQPAIFPVLQNSFVLLPLPSLASDQYIFVFLTEQNRLW